MRETPVAIDGVTSFLLEDAAIVVVVLHIAIVLLLVHYKLVRSFYQLLKPFSRSSPPTLVDDRNSMPLFVLVLRLTSLIFSESNHRMR